MFKMQAKYTKQVYVMRQAHKLHRAEKFETFAECLKESWKNVNENCWDNESVENEFPKFWNHIKKQYVAIVHREENEQGEIKERYEFVTTRSCFTSSGKNAELTANINLSELATGTIIEVKKGSYKNMCYDRFMKLSENCWVYKRRKLARIY